MRRKGKLDLKVAQFSWILLSKMANKIEQSFYSVYSCSGIESIEHALSLPNCRSGH